jgi:hypothetical protein
LILKKNENTQLIDSLEAGGAERMAVNYANALAKQMIFSGLRLVVKKGRLLIRLMKVFPICFE